MLPENPAYSDRQSADQVPADVLFFEAGPGDPR